MTASVLAVDVGGTKVALRRTDGDVALEASFTWQDGSTADQDARVLRDAVDGLVRRGGRVDVIGVAFPGALHAGRVVRWPSRPSWEGRHLNDVWGPVAREVPVVVADDGDCAALAEARARGLGQLLYLGLGTGVGGGVVADGRVFPGTSRGSCEVGHVLVDPGGPACTCGRSGCLQSVASGTAVLARSGLDPRELRRRWLADPTSVPALRDACRAVAVAAVSLSEVVCPEAIVVGGGLTAALDGLVEVVADEVAALARPGRDLPPVLPALFDGLSSLEGAVELARDRLSGR